MANRVPPLQMWTIYNGGGELSGRFVARLFEIGHGPEPRLTGEVMVAGKIDELREQFARMGMTPIARSPGDDPAIIETWF